MGDEVSVSFSVIRTFIPETGPIYVDFSDLKDWFESSSSYSFPDAAFSRTLSEDHTGAVAELFLSFKRKRDAMMFKLVWHGVAEQVDMHDWDRLRKHIDRLPVSANRHLITKIVRMNVDI